MLPKELQEFVDAAHAAADDGRWTADEIHLVARAGIDCLGPLAKAAAGDAASIARLSDEAKLAALEAIDALPDGRLGMKPLARLAVEYVVPSFVRSVAEAAEPVTVFLESHVLPRIAAWEATLHHLRTALGG